LPRVLSTAFVIVLLAATAGVFALTEGAKLERSPLFATHVARVFSPACDCKTREAFIDFRLRRADHLTVWMERGDERVDTLTPGRDFPAGRVSLVFDGITDTGRALPDGVYTPVVHLGRSHRTIRLPSPIRLDARAPAVRVPHPLHAIISPDGDRRRDSFSVRYRVDEPARAILIVNRRRVVLTYRKPLAGELVWNGRFGRRAARPGLYVLEASAEDVAGNRAEPVPFAIVQVRYVALGRKRIVVRPGGKFAVRVSTDAPTVRWQLHGRSGFAQRGTVRLRAPRSRGVFKLYVTAAGHAAKASVVVA
jgi:hypothetical protein